MSIFGDDGLAQLKGFEKVYEQQVKSQKAAFVGGYKEGYDEYIGIGPSILTGDIVLALTGRIQYATKLMISNGASTDNYKQLGFVYGSLVAILKSVMRKEVSDSFVFEQEKELPQLVEAWRSLSAVFPTECKFIREKLMVEINQYYVPNTGKNKNLDTLMFSIIDMLSKYP